MKHHLCCGVAQPGALVVLAWVMMLGCSRDAAPDGPGSSRADAAPRGCTTPTWCDGAAVRACVQGQPGDVLEECAPDRACSLGRCVSGACAAAEAQQASFLGCLFYTLKVDNVSSDDDAAASVLVTNPGQTVATVELQQRDSEGEWKAIDVTAVAPLQSSRLTLRDGHFEGGGYGVRAAMRLSSDVPLWAVHIQSDDATESASSSGGTTLLPVQALGQNYLVMTYAQAGTPKILTTAGARGGAGQVTIVGTQDGTHVTFQVSAHARLGLEGGAPALAPGESFGFALDAGDIYQIFSIADGDDLTGSAITADRPVAVFSGNISTTYGRVADGINSPDMAHEQMLPLNAWGLGFVAASLPPQAQTCDSVLGQQGASLWRILAAQDGTLVTFEAPSLNVVGLPTGQVQLDRGQVSELVVSGGSFVVKATRPVMVTQGMDCEPTMAPAVAADPLLKDLRFAVLPKFEQMIAIVRKAGIPAYLDGAAVDDGQFLPAGGGFEVARLVLPSCPDVSGVCTHHLEGQFGMTMRGMDVLCSYALTAPTWFQCIDPNAPGCVD